ncbi:MAG: GDSL-type esterase/lipase family protein [Verrucomicrobiota bacterium]
MSLSRLSFLRLSLALTSLAFVAGCATQTSAPVAPVDPALRDPEKNAAIKPGPRDANWVKRHDGFVEIAKKGGVNLLFIGDSITDAWRNPDPTKGKAIWDREFAPYGAANFGISGDRTQHLLWRLQNGELDGISPKLVVMMIGTNNTGFERDGTTPRNTTPQIVEGVTAIVKHLRAKLPTTKILLLAVFPRAEKPDHPSRLQVNAINTAIAKLADGKTVRYLDINQKFLAADGTLPKDIMPDFLHPNAKGYEIWAAAIKAPVAEMMK